MTPFGENKVIDISVALNSCTKKALLFLKKKICVHYQLFLHFHPHKVHGNNGNSHVGGVFKVKTQYRASHYADMDQNKSSIE